MPRSKNNNQQEPLKKSDWIQYLSHVASKNQNFKLLFYSAVFATLTIIVAILVSLPQIGINDALSKGIISVILSIYVYFIWREASKFSYNVNSLTEKSADKLLSEIVSLEHPELKNAREIQRRWEKLKQKIDNTGDKERKQLLKKSFKKTPDEQFFNDWFDDTL